MIERRRTSRALRVREVAERLAISHDQVTGLIRAGKIRAFNITENDHPKRPEFRIFEDEVARFVESRQIIAVPIPDGRAARRAARRKRPPQESMDYFPDFGGNNQS